MGNKKKEINEKIFIELYKSGKSDVELSMMFEIAERTIQRYVSRLRAQGKIPLRTKLATNATKKEKTTHKFDDVFEEVEVYIANAKRALDKYFNIYRNVKLKTRTNKNKQKEDIAIVWSDMHTGMINKHPITKEITYDEKIQEEELNTFLKGVLRLRELYSPSYNMETIHIFDPGDNITNNRIFEGQLAEITCGVGEQIMKTFQYQSDFIKKLLEVFPKVKMYMVPGNHGRTTAKPMNEEASNSFEYLLGKLLQERFRDNQRVEISVPNTYTTTIEIYGHKYLLTHGNIVRGCTLNSIERAVKDIASLAYSEFYDLIIIGHFHTALKLRITPETNLLVNGCWIENDDYAYNKLHKFSSATQYMFNISKKSPMHNVQEIDLKWNKNKKR